jgi:hypothetical protein
MENITNALLLEAQFTSEMLSAGYEQIGKANYAQKGMYFQAFTSLSTGIERLGKICLILEYIISSNGNLPNDEYIKKQIGHDLEKIYTFIVKIKEKYNFKLDGLQNLDSEIYKNIINILSRFGKGDRYSNIDLITKKRNYLDPISEWYKNIDLEIFNTKIKKNKKEYIEKTSQFLDNILSDTSMVVHTGEDESEIDTIYKLNYQVQIYYAIEQHRRIYVYQIIRFFTEILINLERFIRKNDLFEIPYFSEIFYIYYWDEKYIKRRKKLL